MVRDSGEFTTTLSVKGEAENTTDGELSYAEVDVKFLAGETVDSSGIDNINGLSAGDVWSFEVQYLGTNEEAITDYEIRAGTSL